MHAKWQAYCQTAGDLISQASKQLLIVATCFHVSTIRKSKGRCFWVTYELNGTIHSTMLLLFTHLNANIAEHRLSMYIPSVAQESQTGNLQLSTAVLGKGIYSIPESLMIRALRLRFWKLKVKVRCPVKKLLQVMAGITAVGFAANHDKTECMQCTSHGKTRLCKNYQAKNDFCCQHSHRCHFQMHHPK